MTEHYQDCINKYSHLYGFTMEGKRYCSKTLTVDGTAIFGRIDCPFHGQKEVQMQDAHDKTVSMRACDLHDKLKRFGLEERIRKHLSQ